MDSADVVGRYALLLRIGSGGMGEVFVAMLRGARNLVACKRLLQTHVDPEAYAASLREEARIAAMVRHPNVCQVYELIDDPSSGLVLVMEYLEGVPLRRLASATSDLALVGGLVAQACAGLHAIHTLAESVVHRDINPSNVFVTVDGVAKILDFGIAKADTPGGVKTRTGSIKGTPHYLAPEQVLGEPVDLRADVFAIGITLFELVTGTSPFRRENEFLTQRAITDEAAPRASSLRPDLPPALDAVIARALARSPHDRFATASELGAAIVAALGPLPSAKIAETIRQRFGLELDERRRKIARAIEAVEDAAPTAPSTAPLDEATVVESPAFVSVVSAVRAPPVRRRRWLPIAAVLAIGTAIGALAATQLRRDPPVVAASIPIDAAIAPVAIDAAIAPVAIDAPIDAPPLPPKPPPPKARAPGLLTIGSRPYAEIFVDGRPFGVTPLFRKSVPAGRHAIRAKCSCGKSKTFALVIQSGLETTRNLTW